MVWRPNSLDSSLGCGDRCVPAPPSAGEIRVHAGALFWASWTLHRCLKSVREMGKRQCSISQACNLSFRWGSHPGGPSCLRSWLAFGRDSASAGQRGRRAGFRIRCGWRTGWKTHPVPRLRWPLGAANGSDWWRGLLPGAVQCSPARAAVSYTHLALPTNREG